MRALSLLLLCCLISAPATADRYPFRVYSAEDGLAQSQVSALHQDGRGHLWIGTHGGGVSRFDGRAFRTFTTGDGLPSNTVLAILEDHRGVLWLATGAGLARFDGETFTAVSLGSGATAQGEPAVRDLLEDRRGGFWVATERGLWLYGGGDFVPMPASGELLQRNIRALWEDPRGRLWIATGGAGAAILDGSRVTWLTTADGLPSDSVYDVAGDGQGGVWIATGAGLSRHHGGALATVATPRGPAGPAAARALLPTDGGGVWIGTDGAGLCRLEAETAGEELTCFTEAEGLSSNVIWSLARDREGNLWIGTYRGGLVRYSGPRFTLLTTPDFGEDVIRSILEDRDGRIWIATFRGGVARYDGRAIRRFTTADGLPHDFALSLVEDRRGRIWIGTYAGLARVQGETLATGGEMAAINRRLSDPVIRALYEDPRGRLWIGTNRGGLARWDGRDLAVFTAADGLAGDAVMSLTAGRDGLWVGTLGGVSLRPEGSESFLDLSDPLGLAGKDVYSVVETAAGDLWLGVFGEGLLHCPRRVLDRVLRTAAPGTAAAGSCAAVSSREGLAADSVVSLLADGEDHLWIGTERGVSHLDLFTFAATGEAVFTNYGRYDGLFFLECVHNALARDRRGRLWIGTVGGAVRYDPEADPPNPLPPLTSITGLRLFFERRDLTPYSVGLAPDTGLPRGLRLPHHRNHLTFDFLGICLRTPEKVRYRYRLEGLEEEWSPPTAEPRATYAGLAPGHYTFRVLAANDSGVWNPAPASLAFTIVPPYWRTGWFIALVSGLLGLLVLATVKLRLRRLETHRRLLRTQVAQRTRDLHREKRKVEAMNRKLEDRVRQRTRELEEANTSLRAEIAQRIRLEEEVLRAKKLESLGLLAGGIAHDFNNFLGTLSNHLWLAAQKIHSPGDLERILKRAGKTVERATALIHQLLDFSRGEEPVKQSLDLAPLAREYVDFVLGPAGTATRARFHLPRDLWPVEADREQLGQVLHNLLRNALEAMPEGGTIHLRARNTTPAESATLAGVEGGAGDGRYVRLTIRDEGAGIPAEHLERIFDPYFSTKERGSGLGLAATYAIVRRHGGHIRVDSTPGAGTSFHLYLPAARAAAGSGDRRPRRHSLAG